VPSTILPQPPTGVHGKTGTPPPGTKDPKRHEALEVALVQLRPFVSWW